MINPFLAAVFLQFSGIVGAGIFALPYLFVSSNFYFVSICLFLLGGVTAILHHLYIDIILKTKGDHQLPGYATIYLNRRFRLLALVSLLILAVGALIAYVILASRCLNLLFGLSSSLSTLVFIFLLITFFVVNFRPLRSINTVIGIVVIFIVLILLSALIQSSLPPLIINQPSFSFFGGVIFSLSGFTIIPEVEEVLRRSRQRHHSHLASSFGVILAVIVYWLFSFAIAKLSGPFITTDSFTGMSHVSLLLSKILATFGLLVTFNAASNFLVVLREIFNRDFHLSPPKSIVLACIFPLLVLLTKNMSYLSVISITGSVTVFISALIICLIRLKMNFSTKTVILTATVILILGLGLLSEVFPF